MSITYTNYLKIEELLELQKPLSDGPEHDEMLFIIIHQVYELWFKQLLHEFDYLAKLFDQKDDARIQHTFKRCLTILKTMVAQVDILETMTPVEFTSFRKYLETSSGFQSFQYRAFEFVLGHKRRSVLDQFPQGSGGRALLEARWQTPSLWEHFLHYIALHGYDLSTVDLSQVNHEIPQPNPDIQKILIQIYHQNSSVTQICEAMVDLDEGQQEWRYRHVKMVERTIGNKQGTGGTMGVDYLQKTLFRPVFPDLWAIRSVL